MSDAQMPLSERLRAAYATPDFGTPESMILMPREMVREAFEAIESLAAELVLARSAMKPVRMLEDILAENDRGAEGSSPHYPGVPCRHGFDACPDCDAQSPVSATEERDAD